MDTITSDDILGKTAVDPRGSLLGVVVKLHIDNGRKRLQGITVDQGFVRPDLYVGMEHVKYFGIDAVFLNTVPYQQLHGKRVFTSHGGYVGTVARVLAEGATLKGLVIAKRKRLKKQEVEVNASEIKEMGQTIILRKGVGQA
ncbi:hypothetical protein GF367_02055 [Candidatus Woesearchaeota archaeon]|nr:hypothetical protein [Candidatus Woesearchaeota archaeon]